MAVQAQLGGLLLPLPQPYAPAEEEQTRALKAHYGVLLPTAGDHDDGYAWPPQPDYYCAAQSELTCNGGGGGGGAAVPLLPSRKRSRDDDDLQHYNLPLLLDQSRTAAAAASTSGRPAEAWPAVASLDSGLWGHAAAPAAEADLDMDLDALVRAECGRLRAGLEAARARQRRALVRAAVSSCAPLAMRAREAEARLEAARRRAAELEQRVRLAAAEAQAWRGVARGNEAVAAGLRATLDALLLRSCSAAASAEGFGGSEPDDARSCCCDVEEPAADATASSSSSNGKWACRACGGEASVLVLPCRHLCLCKACEPRTDVCPVCSGAKNGSIHIAPN